MSIVVDIACQINSVGGEARCIDEFALLALLSTCPKPRPWWVGFACVKGHEQSTAYFVIKSHGSVNRATVCIGAAFFD